MKEKLPKCAQKLGVWQSWSRGFETAKRRMEAAKMWMPA